jgi:hypothetical protein
MCFVAWRYRANENTEKFDVTMKRRSSSQLHFMPGEEIPLMYDSKPLSHAVLYMNYYWIISGS